LPIANCQLPIEQLTPTNGRFNSLTIANQWQDEQSPFTVPGAMVAVVSSSFNWQ
jgi:hypothetical protein